MYKCRKCYKDSFGDWFYFQVISVHRCTACNISMTFMDSNVNVYCTKCSTIHKACIKCGIKKGLVECLEIEP